MKLTVETTRLLENDVTVEGPAFPPLLVRVTVQHLHGAVVPEVSVDTLDELRERRHHRVLRRMPRAAWEKLKAEIDLAFNTFEETFDK